ncbi:MAG: hypothetical protein VXZ53_21560, partial [Planctomycetota bacterium]|nr:hypothetical protein [Planctomycetota bacterium]
RLPTKTQSFSCDSGIRTLAGISTREGWESRTAGEWQRYSRSQDAADTATTYKSLGIGETGRFKWPTYWILAWNPMLEHPKAVDLFSTTSTAN